MSPRTWETYEPPNPTPEYVPDPVFEPVTSSRPASPEEIPRSAGWAVTSARDAGLAVEVLYAQGGGPRWTPPRGACPACSRPCLLYADDGTIQDHNVELAKCPPDVAWTDEGGKRVCGRCGRTAKPIKAPRMPAHSPSLRACVGGHQVPAALLEPEEMEPVRTINVRVPGLGVGVWEDGRFVAAWLLLPGNVGVSKVGAREWARACKQLPGEVAADGSGGQDLPDAGLSEGGHERDTVC